MVCYAPYDPMELTLDDMAKDHLKAYDDALRKAMERDPKDLSDEVYQEFRFDLCPPCRKAFADNPLGN